MDNTKLQQLANATHLFKSEYLLGILRLSAIFKNTIDIRDIALEMTRCDFINEEDELVTAMNCLRHKEHGKTGHQGAWLPHLEDQYIFREVRESYNMKGVTIFDFRANQMLMFGAFKNAVIVPIIPATLERLEKWYGFVPDYKNAA